MNKTDSIEKIKGIGAKKAELFNKLGIFTCEDLINYFDIDVVNKLVDENHHKNSKNVFICGEALINNGITAFAIKDGIKCAKEVEEYLEA